MIYEERLNDISIRLVPFSQEHLTERYRRWFYNPIITLLNSHGLWPYTNKQMKEFYQSIEDNGDVVWAIEAQLKKWAPDSVPEDGRVWLHIGNVSIQSIDLINRSAELAILIGDLNYHKQGIGKWACRMAMEHGMDKLNLHRIWLGTAASNKGMQKIAKACGMIHEATLRDGAYLNGMYENVLRFGILSTERK